MKVCKCPVCLGCGSVPAGFYSPPVRPDMAIPSVTCPPLPETCRSCHGRGIVYAPEDVTIAPLPAVAGFYYRNPACDASAPSCPSGPVGMMKIDVTNNARF